MSELDAIRRRGVVSVPEAAEVLGIGKNLAYTAAAAGTIPTLRIGRRVVVPVAPLLKLIGQPLPTAPQEAA